AWNAPGLMTFLPPQQRTSLLPWDLIEAGRKSPKRRRCLPNLSGARGGRRGMGAIAERTAGKTDHLSDRLGEAERATLASLLNARILAVADAFDAMTSNRIYRPAKSYEAAVAELDRCAGRQFDQQVVAAFRRVPRKEWEGITRRKAVAARAAVERIGTVALV